MKKKKKNKEFLKLSSEERPMFGDYKRVHRTKKEKMNSRQNQKKVLREKMNEE